MTELRFDTEALGEDRLASLAEMLGSEEGWTLVDDGTMDTVVELDEDWFQLDDGTIVQEGIEGLGDEDVEGID